MSKKGMFFSIVAIMLAGLAIVSFISYNQYRHTEQMRLIDSRVSSMSDFLTSVETDLGRALYISSYRGLIALNDHITNVNKSQGRLLDDTKESFSQIVVNGTIGPTAEVENLMVDQTIIDWAEKIRGIGESIGIDTKITLNEIDLIHISPWRVEVEANFTLKISDGGTAMWERDLISVAEIPITGFRDPFYANRTHGGFRTIVRTSITLWNVSNLEEVLISGEYIAKSSAPTFLMRMEGNLTGHPFGIFTLIDAEDLYVAENRSKVDFVYWRMVENNTQKIAGISDQPRFSDFSLDPAHIVFFNVVGLNYTGP